MKKTVEEKNYCIYQILNTTNGKKYFGQTCNLIKRKSSYKNNKNKGQTKIYRAINKYGWENFEMTILFKDLTLAQANDIEIYLIAFYNTTKQGYNCLSGGSNGRPTMEARLKQSERMKGTVSPRKGFKASEETKKRQSEAKLKNPNKYWLGKERSDDTKEKLRQANLGKTYDRKTLFTKEVDLEIVKLYMEKSSMIDLGKQFGCDRKTIWNLLDKYRNIIYPIGFKNAVLNNIYAEEIKPIKRLYSIEEKEEMLSLKNSGTSLKEIGNLFGVKSKENVFNIIKKFKLSKT